MLGCKIPYRAAAGQANGPNRQGYDALHFHAGHLPNDNPICQLLFLRRKHILQRHLPLPQPYAHYRQISLKIYAH